MSNGYHQSIVRKQSFFFLSLFHHQYVYSFFFYNETKFEFYGDKKIGIYRYFVSSKSIDTLVGSHFIHIEMCDNNPLILSCYHHSLKANKARKKSGQPSASFSFESLSISLSLSRHLRGSLSLIHFL